MCTPKSSQAVTTLKVARDIAAVPLSSAACEPCEMGYEPRDSASKHPGAPKTAAFLHTPFFHVHSRLYLAMCEHEAATRMAKNVLTVQHVVVPLSIGLYQNAGRKIDGFAPCSLAEIQDFDATVKALSRQHAGFKIVFCTGTDNFTQVRAAFLVGCHMIATHGIGFEETYLAFKNLHLLFAAMSPNVGSNFTIQSCWRAICGAKCMNWIDFRDVFETETENEKCIQMEEYIHYVSEINGEIYNIVPKKIMLFKAPSKIVPDDKGWIDVERVRHFSPAFYAEIFEEMQVSLVLRLDSSDYNPQAFEQRGIRTLSMADLGCEDASSPYSPDLIENFIAALQSCNGPAAIHCDGCLDLASTLITAYLVRNRCFSSPAEAASWIRIARGSPVSIESALFDTRSMSRRQSVSQGDLRLHGGGGGGGGEQPHASKGARLERADSADAVSATPSLLGGLSQKWRAGFMSFSASSPQLFGGSS